MSEKKPTKTKKEKSAAAELSEKGEGETFVNPQRLTVGVNFTALGETEETRVEAGLIEKGTLPPAFEQVLRERKQLFDV